MAGEPKLTPFERKIEKFKDEIHSALNAPRGQQPAARDDVTIDRGALQWLNARAVGETETADRAFQRGANEMRDLCVRRSRFMFGEGNVPARAVAEIISDALDDLVPDDLNASSVGEATAPVTAADGWGSQGVPYSASPAAPVTDKGEGASDLCRVADTASPPGAPVQPDSATAREVSYTDEHRIPTHWLTLPGIMLTPTGISLPAHLKGQEIALSLDLRDSRERERALRAFLSFGEGVSAKHGQREIADRDALILECNDLRQAGKQTQERAEAAEAALREANEQARRFYNADGTFETLDPEEVVRRRIAAAKDLLQLKALREDCARWANTAEDSCGIVEGYWHKRYEPGRTLLAELRARSTATPGETP